MKIKTKLGLGFSLLFVVIILFGGISLYYMNKISENAKVILKDNYESLHFSDGMRQILDESPLPLSEIDARKFAIHLTKEKNNITEKGEGEAVSTLETAYKIIIDPIAKQSEKQQALQNARLQLRVIDEINMEAIVRKNAEAQKGVEKAAIFLISAAAICFLIVFSFAVNFSDIIVRPLSKLSDAIKELRRQNYKHRLRLDRTDEFTELATEFNAMAAQLGNSKENTFIEFQSEKTIIEAIIELIPDAIIGLNKKKEVLFLNQRAEQLLNLAKKNIVGSNIVDLMKENPLLKKIIHNSNADSLINIPSEGKELHFQLERKEIMVPSFEDEENQVIAESRKITGELYILKLASK